MGNVFSVVLTVPFAPRDAAVVEGLRELGFWPAVDPYDAAPRNEDHTVWLRLGRKMPVRLGWDGFRDAVLALPWSRDRVVETHLQVLWMDDHTTEDDSWGGRVSPYSWQTEAWVVPRG